jgi:hypothetical protein
MGLFSTPPKRITKIELDGKLRLLNSERGIYGQMKTGGYGEKLTPEKFKVFKSIVESSLDTERHQGKDWSGITAKELPEIERHLKSSGHFNEKQIAKAMKHLNEKL